MSDEKLFSPGFSRVASVYTLDIDNTPQLLQQVFVLLATLALDNLTIQARLVSHSDLLLNYLDISGVEVEAVLTAAVRNNPDIIKKKGKEWCKLVLQVVIRKNWYSV